MKDIQAFSCRCVSSLGRLDMLPRFWWTARSKSLRSSRQRSGESFFETRSLDQFWRLHNFFVTRLWEWKKARATTVLSTLDRRPRGCLPSTGLLARTR